MGKQKYKALGPIGKPGKPEFKEGDTLELDEKNAERMLRVGAVKGPIGGSAPSQPPAGGDDFDPTNVADDELKDLRRDDLVKVAEHEGVEGIDDKNMDVIKAEILEIRKARNQE